MRENDLGAAKPLAHIIHQITAASVLVFVLLAQAQAEEASDSDSYQLTPVVVKANTRPLPVGTTEGSNSYTTGSVRTATPLDLSIRETPQSVSVVTQERIEDQKLSNVMDVVENATGVSVNRYETSRAQFNARGFNINNLMIDGVPTIWEQAWSSGEVFSSLAIYDRVEIVRGANGLMTGAGDPSASINLVHKRANSKEVKGDVAVHAGRWDTWGAQADLSSALNSSGSVRARVVAEYQDGDNWVDMYANQKQVVYGTLDFDLSDSTVLWVGASMQKNHTDSPMWGGLPYWYNDGTRTDWNRSKTTSADWSEWNSSYNNYFANVEHLFANGWQLKLGYDRGEREADSKLLYLYNALGIIANPPAGTMMAMPGAYETSTDQDNANISANGPFSLFGRQHQLALGYVYNKQKFNADQLAATPAGGTVTDINSYDGHYPEPTWAAASYYGDSETTQQGAYAMARFSLMDPLNLILGARMSNYERKSADIYSAAPSHIDIENELTPYVGLVYDITEQISAYASYTSIFQPQSVRDINGKVLDPIVGDNTELGVKGEFFNGGLNASLAVFKIKQDKLGKATGVLIPGSNNEMSYEESDGATSQGVEMEVSGMLAEGWQATLGYTIFDLEDADGRDINTLYPTQLLRFFTRYQFDGALNKLAVGGGANWQNKIYSDISAVGQRITQDAYTLVSVMASYDWTQQLSTQVNVSNLLDETYFDVFDGSPYITYGAPRNISASVRYQF